MLENKPLDNRSKILNAAQHMLQTRGFNAFSYRDLAAEVNIKSSSVHYHFPTKEDLAVALLEKYSNAIQIRLATLNRGGTDPLVRIRNFLTWFDEICCLLTVVVHLCTDEKLSSAIGQWLGGY